MFWKLQPLTGWRKALAILWTGVLGVALGVWAETCRYWTNAVPPDEAWSDDPIIWNLYFNALYIGYGIVMGLLWGEIFCKVQKSVGAWLSASVVTIAISAILPYRIEGHMYEQATAIGFFAPTSFAAVHGLWLIPWRQRPWTDFVEPETDEETESHV